MRTFTRLSRSAALALAIGLIGAFILTQANTSTGQATATLSAGGSRIAFVDIDKVFSGANVVQGLLGNLEKEAAAKSEAIEKKMAQYEQMSAEMKQKSAILSDAEMKNMRGKMRDLDGEIKEGQYDLNAMLSKSEKDTMEPTMKLILKTIEEVGKEEGFDMVLRGEMVLYGNPAINLSNRVIEKLNSQTTSVPDSKTPTPVGKTPNL